MSLLLFNADFSLLSDDLDAALVLVLNCCCGIGMFGCWPFMNGNGKFIRLCAAAGFIWRCCWANAAARCGGNGLVDAAGFVADGWLPRLCMKARVSNSRRSDSGFIELLLGSKFPNIGSPGKPPAPGGIGSWKSPTNFWL